MKKLTRRAGNILIPSIASILIPAVLYLVLESGEGLLPPGAWAWGGYPLFPIGLYLTLRAALLVYVYQDTPLGDLPPEHLVTTDVFRFVRNPMAWGMTLVLLSEVAVFRSVFILLWAVLFFGLSHWLAIKVEEPSLRTAFGATYEAYCRATPRWLPRLSR